MADPRLGFAVDVDVKSAERALEILARLQSMAGGVAASHSAAFSKALSEAAQVARAASQTAANASKEQLAALKIEQQVARVKTEASRAALAEQKLLAAQAKETGKAETDAARATAQAEREARAEANATARDRMKAASERARIYQKEAADAARAAKQVADSGASAAQARAAAEKKWADTTARVSKLSTDELVGHIKHLQDEKQKLANASLETTSRTAKAELKIQKDALDAELRAAKQHALERPAVNSGGAGGKVGLLGTGRQVVGSVKADLMSNVQGMAASSGIPGAGALAALGPAGMAAAAGVGALAAGLGYAINKGQEFEAGLAEMQAITGVGGQALADLGGKARELALRFGGEATDQITSFKTLLSKFGPDIASSPEALAKMTENVNILSKASGDDAATSVNALTSAMLQFGVDLSDPVKAAGTMTEMTNMLAASAQVGSAEIPQVAEAINVAGVAAKGAKLSFAETNAAIQALAKGGKVGAEAGTALRNMLGLLQKQSGPGAEMMAKLGTNTKELGEILTTQGIGAAVAKLKGGIDGLGSAAEKNAAMMTMFGAENSAAAGILMDNVGTMKEYTKGIEEGTKGQGAAYEQAAVRMATFGESMSRLKAKASDMALSIWAAIQPMLAKLMPILEVLADVVGVVVPIAFEAAIWPIKAAATIISTLIGWVVKAVSSFYNWVSSLKVVQAGFLAAKTAIMAVVGWITEAYEKIKGVVNAVGDFLGLGGEEVKVPVKVEPTVDPAAAGTAITDALNDPAAAPAEGGSEKKGKGGKAKTAAEIAKEEFDKYSAAQKALLDEKIALIERDAILTGQAEDVTNELKLQAQQKYNGLILQKAKDKKQSHAEIERDIAKADADLRAITFNRAKATLEEQQRLESELLQDSKHTKAEEVLLALIHKEELLAVAKTHGQNTVALEKEVRDAKRAVLLQQAADAKEAAEKAAEVTRDIRRREIALIANDRDRQIAEENLRYSEELEKVKDNARLVELVELDHQKRLGKIATDAVSEREKQVADIREAARTLSGASEINAIRALEKEKQRQIRQTGEWTTENEREHQNKRIELNNAALHRRLDMISAFAEKETGIQSVNLLLMKGEFKNFLRDNLNQLALNQAAKLAMWAFEQGQRLFFWVLTETGMTTATVTGEAVRTGAQIAGDTASTASATAAAGVTTAATVGSMATIAAAAIPAATAVSVASFGGASVSGLTLLLGALAAAAAAFIVPTFFAEGGVATQAQPFTFGGGRLGIRGEAGDEAHIPLKKYPGMKALMSGNFGGGGEVIAAELRGIRRATEAFDSRPRINYKDIEEAGSKYAKKKQLITY